MRKAKVFVNEFFAGMLIETDEGYFFNYDEDYYNSDLTAVSLTLPKTKKQYYSKEFFNFFRGLLQEGWLKELSEDILRIDKQDEFLLLIKNGSDCVGNVSVVEFLE